MYLLTLCFIDGHTMYYVTSSKTQAYALECASFNYFNNLGSITTEVL